MEAIQMRIWGIEWTVMNSWNILPSQVCYQIPRSKKMENSVGLGGTRTFQSIRRHWRLLRHTFSVMITKMVSHCRCQPYGQRFAGPWPVVKCMAHSKEGAWSSDKYVSAGHFPSYFSYSYIVMFFLFCFLFCFINPWCSGTRRCLRAAGVVWGSTPLVVWLSVS